MNLQLQVSKGQSVPSAAFQPSYKSASTPSELNHVVQPAVQQSSSAPTYFPDSGFEAAEESYGVEEEGLIFDTCFLIFVRF